MVETVQARCKCGKKFTVSSRRVDKENMFYLTKREGYCAVKGKVLSFTLVCP